MTIPWEGVPLAPRHWPGQARVLTLASTLKLMFGKDFEIIRGIVRHAEGGRYKIKYTDLPLDRQVEFYRQFRDYYDHNIQRTLT